MESTVYSAGSITSSKPSFEITLPEKSPPQDFPWDKINSILLIELGRRIYFNYLSRASTEINPIGVVVNIFERKGNVVFSIPILLPNEKFLHLKHLIPSKRFKKTKKRI